MIKPQELELIKSRNKPNAIAARAIIRRGTGHKYWSSFSEDIQKKIETSATELYKLIFEPALTFPIKSLDLPAGGPVYSAPALRMIYDFVNLCIGVPSPDDDNDGLRTREYLARCRRVMRTILSNDVSSLGLHPAVYFYSWTGKQQPILFLVITELIIDYERAKRLPEFIQRRENFENFLVGNRALVNQVVRKFGTKASGSKHLRGFYDSILNMFGSDYSESSVLQKLKDSQEYSYLQPGESPYESTSHGQLSTSVKSGIVLKELVSKAHRCPVCGGLVPRQAISMDHTVGIKDGGGHSPDNIQMTHPYCNSAKDGLRI